MTALCLSAVALALILLPEIVVGVVSPPAVMAQSPSGRLLAFAATFIGVIGQLAVVRLAIGPSTTVGEAIGAWLSPVPGDHRGVDHHGLRHRARADPVADRADVHRCGRHAGPGAGPAAVLLHGAAAVGHRLPVCRGEVHHDVSRVERRGRRPAHHPQAQLEPDARALLAAVRSSSCCCWSRRWCCCCPRSSSAERSPGRWARSSRSACRR